MADEVLRLAYEAASKTLDQQDATLGNLRTRSTGLLGAAAVATTFASGVGLVRTGSAGAGLPAWAGWWLLAVTAGIGASVLVTLWPARNWTYGVSAGALLHHRGADLDDVLRAAVPSMIREAESNERVLDRRFGWYRVGVGLLTLQALSLVLAILVS